MKQKKYHIGEIFAIPLTKCYAIGIIVRTKGPVLLGFFLNKIYDQIPKIEEIKLEHDNFILKMRFGSLGLDKGKWQILGAISETVVLSWDIPQFKRKDVVNEDLYKVKYSDELKEINLEPMGVNEDLNKYPDDVVAGYIALEKRLAKLLNC